MNAPSFGGRPTAPRLETDTATTPSFAGREARCILPAAKAAPVVARLRAPQRLGIEHRLRLARREVQAGAGAATRADGSAAHRPGRQPQGAHGQLARVHAQQENTQRKHWNRVCPRRRGGHGHAELSRRKENAVGPDPRGDSRPNPLTAEHARIGRGHEITCPLLVTRARTPRRSPGRTGALYLIARSDLRRALGRRSTSASWSGRARWKMPRWWSCPSGSRAARPGSPCR